MSSFATTLCYPDYLDDRRLVFLCDKLSIIEGEKRDGFLQFDKFNIPVKNFSIYKITISKNSIKNLDLTIGGESNNTAKFLCIYPDYNGIDDTDLHYLLWGYTEDNVNDIVWNNMSYILMLSGTDTNSINPISIKNEQTDNDIIINVMVCA